jgi:hypothetical protein
MVESLTDLAARLEQRIKDLRKAGDLSALLAAAADAADEVERRISDAGADGAKRNALMSVQRLTFNAAADAWPGWSIPDQPPDPDHLRAGRALAERSARIVGTLELPPVRQATGIWLVGAFDLALGRHADAFSRFATARAHYLAANAPGLVLLTDGYLAILRQIAPDGAGQGESLEQVCARMSAGEFKDGPAWVAQLRTAQRVFVQQPSASGA